MKKSIAVLIACILVALLVAMIMPAFAQAADGITIQYGEKTLTDWQSGNFADVWDLTKGDLTLSYTLDLGGVPNAGWNPVEVGLRQVGAPNLDPNLMGGWMMSRYAIAGSNPTKQNLNDMNILMKHGWLYDKYDAADKENLVPPFWYGINFCFWFDRDGVDQWQATQWDMKDGVTYNTGGVYDIVISYHAIDDTTGTMFATVNGWSQGFYTTNPVSQQPNIYPTGRSFTGDMTKMQVFAGRGSGGGSVTLQDITATGVLFHTINFLPPINNDGSSIFKLGSTIPVKFELKDANGNYIPDAIAAISVYKITDLVIGDEAEAVSTSAATTGNLFRYTGDQYIFNLNTKGLSTGTWLIRATELNGTSQDVIISLR